MEIMIRQVSGAYIEVVIKDGGTTMDLGLFDPEEANELSKEFKEAAERLSDEEGA